MLRLVRQQEIRLQRVLQRDLQLGIRRQLDQRLHHRQDQQVRQQDQRLRHQQDLQVHQLQVQHVNLQVHRIIVVPQVLQVPMEEVVIVAVIVAEVAVVVLAVIVVVVAAAAAECVAAVEDSSFRLFYKNLFPFRNRFFYSRIPGGSNSL